MAVPTFYITDGIDRIEWLEAMPNYALAPVSGGLGGISAKTHAFDAPVRSAQNLRFSERYTFAFVDECTDDLADRFQKLVKMFRRSWQRNNKLRYLRDVYIVEQSSGETNTRYAKIWAAPELNFPHPVFNDAFEQIRAIENFGFGIERGIWRSGVPGILPTVMNLDETDGPADPTQVIFSNFQDDHVIDTIMRVEDGVGTDVLMQLADGERGDTGDFDAVTPVWDKEVNVRADFDAIVDADVDMNDAIAAAHDGATGLEFTVDDGNAMYGSMNMAVIDQTSAVTTHWVNMNDATVVNAGQIWHVLAQDGAAASTYLLILLWLSGEWVLQSFYYNDVPAIVQVGANYTLSSGWNRIDTFWQASSAPAADDGFMHIFVNGVLVQSATGLDNDTHDIDVIHFGGVIMPAGPFGGSFYMDTIKIDPVGTLFADKLAAMVGQYGYVVPIMDATVRLGTLDGPSAEPRINSRIRINPNTLGMTAGDVYNFITMEDGGVDVFLAQLDFDGTSYRVSISIRDDGAAFTTSTPFGISDAAHIVEIQFSAATAPAANDGWGSITVDGVLIETLAGIDNDTRSIDDVDAGAENLDAGTFGLFYFDEFRWWVPDSEIFPDPASVDDIYYVGSDEPFWIVPWNLITAGVYTGVTFLYEYSDNGGGWPDLTLGDDLMLYPDRDPFDETGIAAMHVYPGDDWAAEGVNGITKYWIRIYITAVNSWTTSPAYNDIYNQRTPEVRIPLASLKGDVPPFVLKRMFSADGGDEDNTMCSMSRIIAGVKSTAGGNDLDNFHSRLNCGGDGLPDGWTVTYGSDTSPTPDPQAPGGDRAECPFALVAVQAMRVRFTGENKLRDYAGEYRVFLRYNQDTGDPGDLALKLRVRIDSTEDYAPAFETGEVTSAGTYDHALIDMIPGDTLLLPFLEIVNADDLDADLIFEIWAEVVTGTADLGLLDLILIPADEWIADLNDPITDATSGTSALRGLNILDVDSGILDNRTIKQIIDNSEITPVETWSRRSSPIEIEPGLDARLYYLIGYYTDGWGDGPFLSENMQGFLAELYEQACWFYLRGAA